MTTSERLVFDHFARMKDCEILHGGWPDFLVMPKDSQPFCIEVKTHRDCLSQRQRVMHKFLLEHFNLTTFVVQNGWCVELQMPIGKKR